MSSENSKYLKISEACDLLRIDKSTLRRYARQGKLSRVSLSPRKVLYIRAEIDELISANTHRMETLSERKVS
ncbi:helix-turn-helix domain-containing protein [Corynebacterium callunae]|uniref:helix-turn-helix transcriptional regulator n=1 Tax=Corynebacterium callunae TaxID=1721 RepID=UPI003981BA8D